MPSWHVTKEWRSEKEFHTYRYLCLFVVFHGSFSFLVPYLYERLIQEPASEYAVSQAKFHTYMRD